MGAGRSLLLGTGVLVGGRGTHRDTGGGHMETEAETEGCGHKPGRPGGPKAGRSRKHAPPEPHRDPPRGHLDFRASRPWEGISCLLSHLVVICGAAPGPRHRAAPSFPVASSLPPSSGKSKAPVPRQRRVCAVGRPQTPTQTPSYRWPPPPRLPTRGAAPVSPGCSRAETEAGEGHELRERCRPPLMGHWAAGLPDGLA